MEHSTLGAHSSPLIPMVIDDTIGQEGVFQYTSIAEMELKA
jgi:hypothetical protein